MYTLLAPLRRWTEVVIVAVVVVLLLYGRRWLDQALGWPSPDERLIIAVSASDDAAIETALALGGSPRYHDPSGKTALTFAALNGNESIASRLLTLGAEVDAADQFDRTPAIYAAINNHPGVVALLLRHGASPSHRDCNGDTAVGPIQDSDATGTAQASRSHRSTDLSSAAGPGGAPGTRRPPSPSDQG